ncbi:hypothetical protein ABZ436_30295 [Micromonospora matsumotoense]|uniref:hypothetical protein n=1 Tax=Micromonospora matsumotoense TaxID=121616 RepID=UPI0033DD80F1
MLPAAPTSPLWWVARWWSRLLTGLAVAIAFAVAGPALSDPGPPAAALPVDASLSFHAAGAPAALTGSPAGIRSGDRRADPAGLIAADRGDAAGLAVPAAGRGDAVFGIAVAERGDAAGLAVPAGAARSVPAPPPAVPAGRTPAATAPRAPPAG